MERDGNHFLVISSPALRSLGGMSHLRRLAVTVNQIFPGQLQLLTQLAHLDSLRIVLSSIRPFNSILNAETLLGLTQLTSLKLRLSGSEGINPAALSSHINACFFSQLGCLSRLKRLCLAWRSVVDDVAFAALTCLTRLTSLEVAALCCPGKQPAVICHSCDPWNSAISSGRKTCCRPSFHFYHCQAWHTCSLTCTTRALLM